MLDSFATSWIPDYTTSVALTEHNKSSKGTFYAEYSIPAQEALRLPHYKTKDTQESEVEGSVDGGYIALVAVTFSILLIIAQRVEARRRRMVRGFVVSMAILLMIRYELQTENLVAYAIALFVSFLFWLLIGRYNQVGSSDSIKVYGMDD